jgi:hypothetical protein
MNELRNQGETSLVSAMAWRARVCVCLCVCVAATTSTVAAQKGMFSLCEPWTIESIDLEIGFVEVM